MENTSVRSGVENLRFETWKDIADQVKVSCSRCGKSLQYTALSDIVQRLILRCIKCNIWVDVGYQTRQFTPAPEQLAMLKE